MKQKQKRNERRIGILAHFSVSKKHTRHVKGQPVHYTTLTVLAITFVNSLLVAVLFSHLLIGNSLAYFAALGETSRIHATHAQGIALWVSPTTGSDTNNDCRTQNGPCKTVARAIDISHSGDTIWLLPGTYTDTTTCTGQAGQAVICVNDDDRSPATNIRAHQPGTVLLKGGDRAAIAVTKSDGWLFSGFSIGTPTDGHPGGACVWSTVSDRLTFQDITCIRDNPNSIAVQFETGNDNITLSRIVIDVEDGQECLFGTGPGSDDDSRGISIQNGSNFVLEDSVIRYASQLTGARSYHNGIIRRNIFDTFDNHGMGFSHDASNWVVENNIFTRDNVTQACRTYWDGPGLNVNARYIDVYEARNLVVRNNLFTAHSMGGKNTVVINYELPSQTSAGCGGVCVHDGFTFYNNILHNTRATIGVLPSGPGGAIVGWAPTAALSYNNWVIDGNIYSGDRLPWMCAGLPGTDSLTTWQSYNCYGNNPDQHSSLATPSFVNYTARNYRIANANAAQVNAGLDLPCPTDDFDGHQRQDGACDIGPFEWQQSSAALDTTQPSVSLTSPASNATVSGSIAVTAAATDNASVASVQFKLNGTNLGAADTTSPYTVFWNTIASQNGSHQLTAVAMDAQGNVATSQPFTIVVDNAGPTITNIRTVVSGAPFALIRWTTNEAATSRVVYGTTPAYGSVTENLSLVREHTLAVRNLTPGTTYHFRIVSVDAQGNTTTSGHRIFTTPAQGQ